MDEIIRLCKVCGKEYAQMSHAQLYCSHECKRAAKREREREIRAERKQWDLNIKNKKPAPVHSIEDVMRFADEYCKKHGRYIQYAEAVRLMERGVG